MLTRLASVFASVCVALVALFGGLATARADVVIVVNKSTQRLAVSVDGTPRYEWPVSTARMAMELYAIIKNEDWCLAVSDRVDAPRKHVRAARSSPWWRFYSTVTVLAKLRGWSTLRPRSRAMR